MTGEFRQKIRDTLYFYGSGSFNRNQAEDSLVTLFTQALTRVEECTPKPEKSAVVTLKGTNVSITIRTYQIVCVTLIPANKYAPASVVLRLCGHGTEEVTYATTEEAQIAYRTVKEALE